MPLGHLTQHVMVPGPRFERGFIAPEAIGLPLAEPGKLNFQIFSYCQPAGNEPQTDAY